MSRKTRRNRAAAAISEPETETDILAAEDGLGGDFDPHISEDTEEEVEIDDVEEDPYEVLQRQFKETSAENAAVKAQYAEERRLRSDLERNEIETHKLVIENALAAATSEKEAMKRAYRDARLEGDIDAELAAQEAIQEADYNIRKLKDGYAAIKEKGASTPSQAKSVDPIDQVIQENFTNPRDRQWLTKHKADVFSSDERKKIAQLGHDLAVMKHKITPGTDEYYEFLDEHMGYTEEEHDSKPEPKTTTKPSQKPPVRTSAPVTRSNVRTNVVRATQADKEAAEDLGMTVSKYIEIRDGISAGKYPGYKFLNQ